MICRLAALTLLTLLSAGCAKKPPASVFSVQIDPVLTPVAVVGGDLSIGVLVTRCVVLDTLELRAGAVELAALETVETLPLGNDAKQESVVQVQVPRSVIDPQLLGIPAEIKVVATASCGDRAAESDPYLVSYLPTVAALVPAFNPRLFWAASTPGDILACAKANLAYYRGGTTETAQFELGFHCLSSELRGLAGERRYLGMHGAAGGLAAIDPGPILLWSKSFKLVSWRSGPADDPMVVYDDDDGRHFVVYDRQTGAEVVGPFALPNQDGVVRSRPTRTEAGEYLFIRSTRAVGGVSLTYYLDRYSAAGERLSVVKLVSYDFLAKSYFVAISRDASAVYLTQAVDEVTTWLAKLDSTSGATLWRLGGEGSLGIYRPVYEGEGRLLAASTEGFYWLSTATGAALTPRFGPASGEEFLVASVEQDESVVMIADSRGGVAQGLYIFAPDGRQVVGIGGALVMRWLTSGWGDGPVLSNFNELHTLHSRVDYEKLLSGQLSE